MDSLPLRVYNSLYDISYRIAESTVASKKYPANTRSRRASVVRRRSDTMESMENQSSGGKAESGIGCVRPNESTLSASRNAGAASPGVQPRRTLTARPPRSFMGRIVKHSAFGKSEVQFLSLPKQNAVSSLSESVPIVKRGAMLEVPQFFRGWRGAPAPSATFITPLPDYGAKKCVAG